MSSNRRSFSVPPQPPIDDVIDSVVGLYELAFPGRVRGYYLVGSHSDGTAIPSSDLDMQVIFKEAWQPGEDERARTMRRYIQGLMTSHVDLAAFSEAELLSEDTVSLKLASRLLFGEDIRDGLSLPDLESYVWQVTRAPQRFIMQFMRPADAQPTFPLHYPDPDAEYYGYTRPLVTREGETLQSLKELVLTVCWSATALVAMQARVYVPTKADCARLYREHINDGWTSFVELLYNKGKREWGYLAPRANEARAVLRHLAADTLAFENHFMQTYIAFLREAAHTPDSPFQTEAHDRLSQLGLTADGPDPFADDLSTRRIED